MTKEEKAKAQIKPDPEKYCEYCGNRMRRVRFESGRLEDLSAFTRRKYCCRECMRKAFVKVGVNEQAYTSSHHSARSIAYTIQGREYKCERCGSTKSVDVHHKDGDRNNNTPENLVLLCRSCHMKEHRPKSICKICGRPAKGHGLCNKHLIRLKKFGSPYMYYHKIIEE